MPQEEWVTLDVREDLRLGREPLKRILNTVKTLSRGQKLRLLTTFEPVPLYRVLWVKGYAHEAQHLDSGDWEILFRPRSKQHATEKTIQAQSAADTATAATASQLSQEDAQDWPPPTQHLDNRGLVPPEPMMHILQALEDLEGGQVLTAINDREPVFLFPELQARGHQIRVDRRPDGVYLTILKGEGTR